MYVYVATTNEFEAIFSPLHPASQAPKMVVRVRVRVRVRDRVRECGMLRMPGMLGYSKLK